MKLASFTLIKYLLAQSVVYNQPIHNTACMLTLQHNDFDSNPSPATERR